MDLSQLRKEIDTLDDQLLTLISRRMNIVEGVADFKIANDLPIYHPTREQEIIARLKANTKESQRQSVGVLFENLLDISKASQNNAIAKVNTTNSLLAKIKYAVEHRTSIKEEPLVAVQGVEGAYSYQASKEMFRNPNPFCFKTFEAVFSAVSNGVCEFGVLPIENSTAGSVVAVYDLLHKYDLKVCDSHKLQITHCLLAKPSCKMDAITDIYSHEQAIGQCSEFLRDHPQIKVHIYSNTAAAAEFVANSESDTCAAIASIECTKLYHLDVIKEKIQDAEVNFTRFICVSKELIIRPDANKISLVLTIPHTPGSLYKLMTRFAVNGLNLTKLESRPIANTDFEFMFYFDFEGSVKDEKVLGLIYSLDEELTHFQFLGNF